MVIKKAAYVKSAALAEQFIDDGKAEILLLGRSNVGKSSFINALANMKKLAHTSSTPGKTRTANYYLINEAFYLVDMPGYGYAKTSKAEREKWKKLIERYIRHASPAAVIQLIDFRHPPTENDMATYQWLGFRGLIPYIIFTKADKLKRNDIKKNYKSSSEAFAILTRPPIIFSAVDGTGKEEVLALLDTILEHQ